MKKRILFVNDVLTIGGVEVSLINVLNTLDYKNISVDVYILHQKYELLNRLNHQVRLIQVNEIRCKLSLAYFWLYLWLMLFKLLSCQKAEAVLQDKIKKLYYRRIKKLYFPQVYDIALAYKHSEAAEFVAHRVNAEKKIFFYHQGEIVDYDLHKQAFATANNIVAVSTGVAEILTRAYPEYKDKIMVIQNLIDVASILERATEYKAPPSKSSFTLATCGRINPEKGFDLAVAAAAFLSDWGYDYHWYFIGDGTHRRQIEELIREKKLNNRITITGMLDNPLPMIAACDIYVQPSYTEAFGLTIAEAMVLKKPIVSTLTLGAKDLLLDGVTGILSDFRGEELAYSIRYLMDHEKVRRELIENLESLTYENKIYEFHRSWRKLLGL